MKVIIGSDHAGFEYKNIIKETLQQLHFEVIDIGADIYMADDDYPDYAAKVALKVLDMPQAKGILICGSAAGVSIAANKFNGIRAAICHDTYSAHQSVEHDNVNVLCLGSRIIGIELAKEIVHTFLGAQFSNEERHIRRLGKLAAIESINMQKKH
jgi:ribose 5-phosphate isomerase B